MIHRLPYFLVVLFVWSLIPTAHHGSPIDPESPSITSQEIAPLALKYRLDICEQIEASTFQSQSYDAESASEWRDPHWLLQVPLCRWYDPCYSFMSMQL